ncbi:lectin like domain-containing protein [Oceanirhabdus seepicola]|uniref:Leucine-rich repeat domain-containing protein n=1 Tax=Oceanirhabdus seepicola TaxID=2828781 RepID=A0A9J6P148_9CLOT|nr:lectin like domain-containing protein [Oceanirhabdus seepicola]MCM1989942.1 leucine-rich repeat domain-containing protein [Oceanirhabdus seepicola]
MKKILSITLILLLSINLCAFGDNEDEEKATGLGREPITLRTNTTSKDFVEGIFPVKFDLREQGRLTPIKNQGSVGSCWTFATYASLESIFKTYYGDESFDFSEQHMVNTNGFDYGRDGGGTRMMSTAYLTRGAGPVPENLDPYVNDKYAVDSPKISASAVSNQIDKVLFISNKDYNSIKESIMLYGAIRTSINWDNIYYNRSTASFYNPIEKSSNHAIAIVGWDDNYSKDNFNSINGSQPKNDGAFIVRNSWGRGFGDDGYFYVSYEDLIIGTRNAVYIPDLGSKYDKIYQYDPYGYISSIGYGTNTDWGANVFTAEENEDIQAVSFYAKYNDINYEIYIQNNVSAFKRFTGYPIKTGTIKQPGYYTIKLDSSITIKKGSKFAVGIKVTSTGGNTHLIPIEDKRDGYSSAVTANPGESYISSDNYGWYDLGEGEKENVCLKAFTIRKKSINVIETSQVVFDSNIVNMVVGETKILGAKVLPQNATDKNIKFSLDSGNGDLDVITIDNSGKVIANKPGTINVMATNGNHMDICTINVAPKENRKSVEFKDINLENAVRAAINKPSGVLYEKDVNKITELYAYNSGIVSLAGIENLTSLQSLSLDENEIVNIEQLSKLKDLKSLTLNNNKISSIKSLGKLNKLEILSIKWNHIKDVEGIEGHTSLEGLDLSNNVITDISELGKLSKLKSLALNNNEIHNISSLSKLKKLEQLNLSFNKISDISGLMGLNKLKELHLQDNEITDYSPTEGYYNNLVYKDFKLDDGQVVTLNNDYLEKVFRYILEKNDGEPILKNELSNIKRLDLGVYEYLPEFKDVSIENFEGIEYLENLEVLIVPRMLMELYMNSEKGLDLSPLKNLKKLTYLDLFSNGIKDISPLSNLTNLQYLNLSCNNIKDITPLKNMTKLEELHLYKNIDIEDISALEKLNNLYILALSQNKISDISVLENFTNLEFLGLSSNKIEDITPLKNMYNLNTLYLYENNIKDYSPIEDKFDYIETKDFDLKGNSSFDNDKIDYLISTYGFTLEELEYIGTRVNAAELKLKKELDEFTLPTYYDMAQILMKEELDVLKDLTLEQVMDIVSEISSLISSEYPGFKYEEAVSDDESIYTKEDILNQSTLALRMSEEEIISIFGEPSRIFEQTNQMIYDDLPLTFIFKYENDTRIVESIVFKYGIGDIYMNMPYSEIIDTLGTPLKEYYNNSEGHVLIYDLESNTLFISLYTKNGEVYNVKLTSGSYSY